MARRIPFQVEGALPGVPAAVSYGPDGEQEAAVSPEQLRRHCLAKPGATESFPFGDEVSVFKVGNRIFAISALDGSPLEVSLKCDPDLAAALRARHEAVRPGYHLNKRHWNTVTLDGSLPPEEIEAMIDDSFDLVVAKLPRSRPSTAGE
jgi:predicted DNA-binding protein (MmcQ/YjbR family)